VARRLLGGVSDTPPSQPRAGIAGPFLLAAGARAVRGTAETRAHGRRSRGAGRFTCYVRACARSPEGMTARGPGLATVSGLRHIR